jgi:DNA-binding MarR family transcriptional regulator
VDRPERSINFKIYTLASSLFKGANQYYGIRFDVGLPEMRVLSTLDREGALAAYQIVALTAMDKALVSRVLTSLHRRRTIVGVSPKSDPRRRTWRLSRIGQDLVHRLRPEWQRREAIIQGGLSPKERKLLGELLDRLLAASEKLRAEEAELLRAPPKRRERAPAAKAA